MFWLRGTTEKVTLGFLVAAIVNFCVDSSELNICGISSSNDSSSNLIYVSTLDGKLSAIDISKSGRTKWTIDFKEGPLISSNISQKEFNSNGKQIKMIPSLSGKLYKLVNGKELELLPITTDQLLGPYSYSNELKFSGGKEKFFYTISTETGKILYKSDITGTNNINGDELLEQDILIVERYQHTVRAIEAPHEQWNYSVAQYKLELKPKVNLDCQYLNYLQEFEIKASIPDGIVWIINRSNSSIKQNYKFDSPIVSIWRMIPDDETEKNDNKLVEVDLFNQDNDVSNVHKTYIGIYNNQIYVQEDNNFNNFVEVLSIEDKVGWKFYPSSSSSSNEPHTLEKNNINAIADNSDFHSILNPTSTSLSTLFDANFANGGFFLYKQKTEDNLIDKISQSDSKQIKDNENIKDCTKPHVTVNTVNNLTVQQYNNNYDDSNNNNNNVYDDTPVPVIASLWHWWKEVVIISISSAILLNIMLTQRFPNVTLSPIKDAIPDQLIVERHIEFKEESKISLENEIEFKSRYLSDFEPIDCLGKGGYGVVFEAKNKIDECNYAIKRIALSKNQNSRDRVMREVRALAKLDHHNIVRYFHAWLECPPAGWQEAHDEIYINKLKLSPSVFTSENSNSVTSNQNESVCIDVPPSDRSSVDSALEAVELNSPEDNNSSSFIVFTAHTSSHTSSSSSSSSSSFNECNKTEISDKKIKSNSCHESNNNHYNCNQNSDSIVFKNSNSNSNNSCNYSVNNRSELSRRAKGKTLPLDFNKKKNINKSPKIFLYIQMQLCQRLSLREWLRHENNPRDYSRIVDIFQQIVDAVEYVHLQGLIHRDLKPSNIFFAYDDKVKIGDFGLVTAMIKCCEDMPRTPGCSDGGVNIKNCFHTACVGTHLYMSPEQRNGQIYNYKVDIYSLGIILFELLTPFSTEMERVTALTNVKKFIFPANFSDKYSQEFDVLKMMLDDNPKNRPTTLGIKARLPNVKLRDEKNIDEDHKWHFELPQLSRHSSVTNSSNSESWENSSV